MSPLTFSYFRLNMWRGKKIKKMFHRQEGSKRELFFLHLRQGHGGREMFECQSDFAAHKASLNCKVCQIYKGNLCSSCTSLGTNCLVPHTFCFLQQDLIKMET